MSTLISWTDETWNPAMGCSKVSAGCVNCYAEALSKRFSGRKGWPETWSPWTHANASENVVLFPDRIDAPRRWRKPRRVFVNSMSDLFHEQIPDSFLEAVFRVMVEVPRHTFQILTKRPERASSWPGPWPGNIWLGTSVENSRSLGRLDHLRRSGASVRFVSFEPLLEAVGPVDLTGIHWVIVGGESGSASRPMDHAWSREIRDAAVKAGTAFFFKQSSGRRTETGKALLEADGTAWEWKQFPGQMTPPVLVETR